MEKSNKVIIGTATIVGIIFVILKLCGLVKWSWWWVTFPFWGIYAMFLIVISIILLYVVFSKE